MSTPWQRTPPLLFGGRVPVTAAVTRPARQRPGVARSDRGQRNEPRPSKFRSFSSATNASNPIRAASCTAEQAEVGNHDREVFDETQPRNNPFVAQGGFRPVDKNNRQFC